jgi:hypothetical protein
MEVFEVGERREVRDGVEFLEQFRNDLICVFPLAEALNLLERTHQRLLGLADGDVRVVLALPFEALLMLEDFTSEEVGETLTR